MRVHPNALETAQQWLKHFVYFYYGCRKQSEVDDSLKHDVLVSFPLSEQHKIPKSGANFLTTGMVKGCTHMPLIHHTNGSNTFFISNMDVGSSLNKMTASNMT